MICDQCETVVHCTKHGCVPKQDFWKGYVPEPNMTECQHRWEPVEGQPMYKCARCGAFMRIIK
jgi:hypothetical protein